MTLKLGSFVTGAVISVFVPLLIVLCGTEEELLAAEGFEAMSPVFTFIVVGAILSAKEDHRSKAQRGLIRYEDGGDEDHHGDHAEDRDRDELHTSGQKLTWKEILSKITDLEARLNKIQPQEAALNDSQRS